jgi:HEAT repeat protein
MADRLAQHLVQRGLLPAERVEEAVRRQALSGGTLDTALLEAGVISEAGVLQAIADVTGQRLVNLADFEPNHEVASLIPPKIAERLGVAPLSVESASLHVACSYPVPTKELEEISFLLNRRLELWVALEIRIRDWISALYGIPLPPRCSALLAALDPTRPLQAALPSGLVEEMTLEDELGQQTLDQLAESVAREPILLEVRKSKASSGSPTTVPEAPAPPRPISSNLLWDQMDTTTIDITGYQAFARESAKASEPTTARPPTRTPAAFVPPPIAPVASRPTPVPVPADGRKGTQPEFPSSGNTSTETQLAPPAGVPFHRRPTQPEVPALRLDADGERTDPMAPRLVAPPATLGEEMTDPVAIPLPRAGEGQGEGGPRPKTPSREPVPSVPPRATPAPAPLAEPADSDEVPHWTLTQARESLKAALEERDQILDVALRYARQTFDFVAAFAVLRGNAVGWDARGEGANKRKVAQISIPLDAQSVFRTVALTRGSYVGPLPPDALTKHFVGLMGRAPRSALVFPVEVKARLVAILYGDSGNKPVSQRKLSDLILFCQDLPGAFQELILFKKQRFGASTSVPFEGDVATPAPAPSTGWSPQAAVALPGLGRAAAMSAPMAPEDERPPPDFEVVLRRLTGPDAAARARAMAELARSPEPSARVLVHNFPGPTAWSRLPVVELPEAEELGPIPGALARLGRPAAQALSALLDADDPDTRYFALLTAGNLPYPELVDGTLRGLFDLEPDISSAARAAATALRKLPRFDSQMRSLRQELAAVDSLRRTLAARALGVLHDRESIDGLIGLTGSQDQMCAQAAAEALREITKVSLGTQPRAWSAWWAENRGKVRAQWLVSALRDGDVDIRLSAIEELSKVVNNNFGYFADAPHHERETAVKRWEQALVGNDRLRRLDL